MFVVSLPKAGAIRKLKGEKEGTKKETITVIDV